MRRLAWAAVAVALLSSLFVAAGAEARTNAVVVQAGAVHPTNKDAPVEFIRYYPDVLRVHRGQVVQWKMLGFHTVTFSRTGRTGWFRPDELPTFDGFPEKTLFGSGCGQPANPCVVNSKTTFASSGAPLFDDAPATFKIDLSPGTYKYFCQIHGSMNGTIQVLGRGAPVPAQRQINAQIASLVRDDAREIDATFKANQKPVSSVAADGRREWRVLVGDTAPSGHAQIFAYMPSSLKIGAGDRVRYVMRNGFVGDPHTVTFPAEAVGDFEPVPHGLIFFSLTPSCDPDSPASGAPGVVAPWGFPGPPCPANAEFLWPAYMTGGHPAPGGMVLTPATYHDSGMLVGRRLPKSFRTLPNGEVLPSSFGASFPNAGEFHFACDIHGQFMGGTVEVG